jgi:hypothetical protein
MTFLNPNAKREVELCFKSGKLAKDNNREPTWIRILGE